MAAQLVVAAAPYKLYAGGVIAFRCIDWLGPARGSLSTEADARSIEGDVVRDTQLTASVIRTAGLTAFQNADDTLTIDVTGIPVEQGLEYYGFFSATIEGDFDDTSIREQAHVLSDALRVHRPPGAVRG